MIKLKLILYTFICCWFSGFSQIPSYYSSVDFSQTGESLKIQLAELVESTHITELNYTPDVWNILKSSDLDPENIQNVLLFYGYDDQDQQVSNDRTRDKNLSCHVSNCNGLWVREHVFPRSLGTPNLGFEYAGADAHHLRPIDSQMNSNRSNRKFDNSTGNSKILSNGYFYPGDEWKGDVARMMMYMYLRYPDQCAATNVAVGSLSYSPLGDMPDIFLLWNEEDPVSEVEIARNNIIENYQGNRNPFIDNPYLATIIWGGPEAENTWESLSTEMKNQNQLVFYPTLTSDFVYIQDTAAPYYQYELYNTTGQLVQNGTIENKIDVSDRSKGVYILIIKNEVQTQKIKIVKF